MAMTRGTKRAFPGSGWRHGSHYGSLAAAALALLLLAGCSGGGPGRFQGYFEHLELEYETKAGLTPMQALVSATSGAAKVINISQEVGTLEKGKLADFVVLTANPLDDIKNTRAIDSVWIGGVRVPAKK